MPTIKAGRLEVREPDFARAFVVAEARGRFFLEAAVFDRTVRHSSVDTVW
jgi:hypothetical protein